MYTAFLIDDEIFAVKHLEKLLKELKIIDIIGKSTNPVEALIEIKKKKPDVVFLDINMPQLSGIDTLKELKNITPDSKVIIVTAYSEFMLESFRNEAFDYLVKPIDRDELGKIMIRYQKQDKGHHTQEIEKIKVATQKGIAFINKENITHIESEGNYSRFFMNEQKKDFLCSTNLGSLQEKLPDSFKRISRRYIINEQYLSFIDKKNRTCTLAPGDNKIVLPYSPTLNELDI